MAEFFAAFAQIALVCTIVFLCYVLDQTRRATNLSIKAMNATRETMREALDKLYEIEGRIKRVEENSAQPRNSRGRPF